MILRGHLAGRQYNSAEIARTCSARGHHADSSDTSLSAYHVYLHLALQEAVDEFSRLWAETKNHPPLTEETASFERAMLQYAIEQARAKVILLTAACVEALANLYIGFRTTPEQFQVLERATFMEKWTVVPSLFAPKYEFPKGSTLYQDLKLTCDRRNALTHLKSDLATERVAHKGTSPAWVGDEAAFISRCRELPMKLNPTRRVF